MYYGGYRRFVTTIYQRVIETRTPVFAVNQEDWKGYDLEVNSVTMPLSTDGARVDAILDAIFTAVQPWQHPQVDASSLLQVVPDQVEDLKRTFDRRFAADRRLHRGLQGALQRELDDLDRCLAFEVPTEVS